MQKGGRIYCLEELKYQRDDLVLFQRDSFVNLMAKVCGQINPTSLSLTTSP